MKRIYQLGETDWVGSKDVYHHLNHKKEITFKHGEDTWHKLYLAMCDSIRNYFKFPYMIGIIPARNDEDMVIVTIFEYPSTGEVIDVYRDKERNLYYIEVED